MADVASRHRRSPVRRRHPLRWLLALVVLLVLALAALALWMARDAGRARDELGAAASLVGTLKAQAAAGDAAAAARTTAELQAHAAQARSDLAGPQWSLASHLPLLGRNVTAVRAVAGIVDDLATGALPALVASTAALGQVTGPAGLDLRPLIAAAPAVSAADAEVAQAQAQLAAIDPGSLDSRVAGPVEQLRAEVADLRGSTQAAARTMSVLPGLLGADGPREYLLVVQSNAEVRATGGLMGFVATLEAKDGRIALTGSRPGGTLPVLTRPILPLTQQEKDVFGPQLGQYFVDTNFTPDFPRTAELATAMWQRETGDRVDGVFSVDPVALAEVLKATGPIKLPDGEELTSDNAVRLLLHEVYLRYAYPPDQDAYFAAAANAIFRAVTSGQGDTVAAVRALAAAATQGRVYAWSAHPEAQAVLLGTDLAGQLVGAQGDSPVVGVYLNDGSGAKMSWFLDTKVTIACRPGGLTATVTMHSNAPADAANLPTYVTGGGNYVPLGHTYTTVTVFSPAGGKVTAVSDPDAFAVNDFTDMQVASGTVDLAPGQTKSFDVELTAPQHGPPLLRQTPGVRDIAPVLPVAGCTS